MKRRDFLIASTTAIAGLVAAAPIQAQPRLNPNSPNAIALGYVENHQRVDARKWSKKGRDKQSQQRCGSCALFNPKKGTCSIFPANRVNPNGWCNAWTSR